MQSEREQLTQSLLDLVQRISTQIQSQTNEEWPELEVTMAQCRTLTLLVQGPERMGNIASQLNISLSSATSMIDRLMEKDLVERAPDANDRRVVMCQLTPKGRDEMDRFLRLHQLQFRDIAQRLSTPQLELVVRAMEILCEAAQKPGRD